MLMTEYLNSWVATKNRTEYDKFIIFQDMIEPDEWEDVMEYDGSDGRLWVHKDFLNLVTDLFGKNTIETMTFIGNWFEDKFNIKVKFVE